MTDEHAPVTVLATGDPLLNAPNKITDAAWNGWVQERGLYFLDADHDSRYQELLQIEDPFQFNKGAKRGALVAATYGKGRWVYVGLGLWRELPAGVDGAYQLLANMISLGKTGSRRCRRRPAPPRSTAGRWSQVKLRARCLPPRRPFVVLRPARARGRRSRRIAACSRSSSSSRRSAKSAMKSGRSTDRRSAVHADLEVFLHRPRHAPCRSTTTLQFDRDALAVSLRHPRRNRAHFDHRRRGDDRRRERPRSARDRESRREPAPAGAFTLAGYAPPSMQMELMRYWARAAGPPRCRFCRRGRRASSRAAATSSWSADETVALDRYSVSGVIWGRETLWLDATGRLAALVSVDAEFDHFEAVRPELEARRPAARRARRVGRDGGHGRHGRCRQPGAEPRRSRSSARTILDMTGRKPILERHRRRRRWAHHRRRSVEPRRRSAAGDRRACGGQDRDARPLGHARPLRAGRVGTRSIWPPASRPCAMSATSSSSSSRPCATRWPSGKGIGPRMLLAGHHRRARIERGLGVTRAATPEEARRGSTAITTPASIQIKIYSSVTLDVLRAITAEAHKLGMTVTGHVPDRHERVRRRLTPASIRSTTRSI